MHDRPQLPACLLAHVALCLDKGGRGHAGEPLHPTGGRHPLSQPQQLERQPQGCRIDGTVWIRVQLGQPPGPACDVGGVRPAGDEPEDSPDA